MPTMQKRTSVATVTDSGNVLAGLPEEFLKRPSALRVSAVCDAITTTQPTVTFMVGDKVLADAIGVMVALAANRIDIPADVIAKGAGAAGTRLTLRFNNLDSATRLFTWRIDIQPVG